MGKVSLEGVQNLLHIRVNYPYFQTYEEVLEFQVDDVVVKAVARHAWRRESVKIIEPFQVEGSTYNQVKEPPFFGLGFLMLKHRESLKKEGRTLTDESIRMATVTYRRHAAYLKNQIIIDAQQDAFFSKFQDELSSLKAIDYEVQNRIAKEKGVLRRQFKFGQISQKDYQDSLKKLKPQLWNSSFPYSELKRKVEMELENIKQSIIDKVLSQRES